MWLIACGSWFGVLTVVGPILMTYMLINQTGKAMMDRRMAKTRGDAYLEYAARTSGSAAGHWRGPRRLSRSSFRGRHLVAVMWRARL